MNTNLIGHEKPVNGSARALFYKAPWWAKAPPEKQTEVLSVAEKLSIEQLIDVTKAPPRGIDRRGVTLRWKNGDTGIVTGFGHAKTVFAPRNPSNNKRPGWYVGGAWDPLRKNIGPVTTCTWWVFSGGEFKLITWKQRCHRAWRASTDENQSWP